ncbi:MAG: methyltransferase [Bacteroides sp.]|nr:methyltransferase [Bacteroides sp.]
MDRQVFRFKRFAVSHSASAMKVGTDGVTLGAWARCSGRVLDVGAGCGLIGLMAAQRGAEMVDMVELDPAAADEAEGNVARSPWVDRIKVYCADFLEFNPECQYDNIISNPPFFATGELAPDPARAAARHQGDLTPQAFMAKAVKLLAPGGAVSVIIPADLRSDWQFAAELVGLRLSRSVGLFTRLRALAPRRVLLEFSSSAGAGGEERLYIQSSDYQSLVNDFYL